MVAIYVLRLQRGKYYVGLTRKNVERIWQHIDGKGAAWTKKYPPKEGKEIVSFQDGLKVADEDRITLEMMSKYGVRNVRGGSWCRVNMSARQVSELERLVKSKSKPKKTKSTTPALKFVENSPPTGKVNSPISSWACSQQDPSVGRPKPKRFPSFRT